MEMGEALGVWVDGYANQTGLKLFLPLPPYMLALKVCLAKRRGNFKEIVYHSISVLCIAKSPILL